LLRITAERSLVCEMRRHLVGNINKLPNTILSFEKISRYLLNFGMLGPNLFLEFSQHVRFNESSKNTENALTFFGKRPQGIFRKPKFLWFWVYSFQNCFWNIYSIFGLSQICKMKNVWKFPNPFSRNTLISSAEKTSCSFKTSWKIST
jgi:hypothetical protein